MSNPVSNSINDYVYVNKDFTSKGDSGRKRLSSQPGSEEISGGEKRRKIETLAPPTKQGGSHEHQLFQKSVFRSPSAKQPPRLNRPSSPLAGKFRMLSPMPSGQNAEKEEAVGTPPSSPRSLNCPSSPLAENFHILSPMPSSQNAEKEEAVGTPPSSPTLPSFVSSPSIANVSLIAFGSPVFAAPTLRAAPKKIVCTPTPRKSFMSSRSPQEMPIFFQNALKYKKSLSAVFAEDPRILGLYVCPGRGYAELGEGNFCKAYAVLFRAAEQTPEEVQVVKIHKLSRDTDTPSLLASCLLSEIEQYIFLKSAGFPVVHFFNFDEFLAQKDYRTFYADPNQLAENLKEHLKTNFLHPFYRVEYVPFSIADTKEEFESYYENKLASFGEDLIARLESQNDRLYQIKKMFEFAWENKVCLDLGLGNLRVREDKTVVLIDLYYDREEEFRYHLMNCLRTFVKDLRSPVLDYLISDLHEDAKNLLADERKRLQSSHSRS